jgi:uncharacterized membrane protein YesL
MGMKYDPSPITIKVIKWSIRTWWDDLTGLAMINLLWVLCWFTILLGPPATLAIYYISYELVGGQSLGLSGFIEGIRKYFLKSWAWALVNLLVFVIIYSNILFYGNSEWIWVRGMPLVMLILGLVWVVVQFYALPFLMHQDDKSLKIAWRNAYVIAVLNPGYTAVIFGFALLVTVLSLIFMLPLFLGVVPLVAVLGAQAVKDRVEDYKDRQRKLEKEQKSKEEKKEH